MIVKKEEYNSEVKIEVQMKTEKNVESRNKSPATEFVVSLNITEIENILTIEEAKYFDNLQTVFDQRWNMIPLGEEMMSLIIKFCKQRHQLPVQFFQLFENQNK